MNEVTTLVFADTPKSLELRDVALLLSKLGLAYKVALRFERQNNLTAEQILERQDEVRRDILGLTKSLQIQADETDEEALVTGISYNSPLKVKLKGGAIVVLLTALLAGSSVTCTKTETTSTKQTPAGVQETTRKKSSTEFEVGTFSDILETLKGIFP